MRSSSESEAAADEIHAHAASRLALLRHRYTTTSRTIVDVLAVAEAPMTSADLIAVGGRATSSTYRALQRLCAASVIREVPHIGDARYELSWARWSGPRCHVQCRRCGRCIATAESPALADVVSTLVATIGASASLVDGDSVVVAGVCNRCHPSDRDGS